MWPGFWGDEDVADPVAAGDLTGDGYPDLIIHQWLAMTSGDSALPYSAGAVAVLQGTANGDVGAVTFWSQDSPGIRGRAERFDGFGSSIGS